MEIESPEKSKLLKLKEISSSSIVSDAEVDDLTTLLGFDVTDVTALETVIFKCINDDNVFSLQKVFEKYPSDTTILQVLLTTSYPNRDGFYRHDPEVLEEASELLGASLENLNALQIACLLGEEDIAMDILEFVIRITGEIQSKKILYEFMGRVWGDGNTTLHLASFMGMTELVSQLLALGAAKGKMNNRKYKPVDCTNDQQTREVFENVEEVNPIRRLSLGNNSVTPSPTKSMTEELIVSSASAATPSAESPIVHKKPISLDVSGVNTRPRSVSTSGKPRSLRSGTASQKDFPTKMLAREKKKSKKVQFDRGTLLIHLCQFRDDKEEHMSLVKSCLGLEGENSVCTLDVNNTYSPQQWLTPLHIACSYGHVDIATLLIEKAGAAVNITDKEGWTPLHCACAEGQIETLNLLLKCQGNAARKNEGVGMGWIYALDGPINLEQENDDGDIPEEVSLEDKAEAIDLLLKECKKSYPPPPRIHRDSAEDDEGDEDGDEEEEKKKPIEQENGTLGPVAEIAVSEKSHSLPAKADIQPPDVASQVNPVDVEVNENPVQVATQTIPFSTNTNATPTKEKPKPAIPSVADAPISNSESPFSEGSKRHPGIRKGSFSKDAHTIQSVLIPYSDFVAMSGEQMKRPLQRRSSKSGGATTIPISVTSKIGPFIGDIKAKPSTHQLMGGISSQIHRGISVLQNNSQNSTSANIFSSKPNDLKKASSPGNKFSEPLSQPSDSTPHILEGGVAALKNTFQKHTAAETSSASTDSLSLKKFSSTSATSSSNNLSSQKPRSIESISKKFEAAAIDSSKPSSSQNVDAVSKKDSRTPPPMRNLW